MKTEYSLRVSVSDFRSSRRDALVDAIDKIGPWRERPRFRFGNSFDAEGVVYLDPKVAADSFVEDVVKQIWKTNGDCCIVIINIEIPGGSKRYFEEHAYKRMVDPTYEVPNDQ